MKRTLSIVLILVCMLTCLSACGEANNSSEKVGLITWEETPDTEAILMLCGLDSDNYTVENKTVPDADREKDPSGEIATGSTVAKNEALIEGAASEFSKSCSVIVFQVGSQYLETVYAFMENNADATVFVLNTSGTEIIASQNTELKDASEAADTTGTTEVDNSGIAELRSLPGSLQLIRNEKNYSLSGAVDCVEGIDYSSIGYYEGDSKLLVYSPKCYATNDGKNGFFSVGDIPVPVLEENDLVVWYSDDRIPTLGLAQVDFYGYGVSIDVSEYDNHYSLNIYDPETKGKSYEQDATNIEVKDSAGNVVDNYYNLNQNETYTVTWYKGTQYNEHSLKASSKFYTDHTSRKYLAADYKIEGTLTEDGYAKYDLSEIPAGLYVLLDVDNPGKGGMVEIKQ